MDFLKEIWSKKNCFEFCNEKELWVANTWLRKEEKTYTRNLDGNKTEIEFLLFGKNNQVF